MVGLGTIMDKIFEGNSRYCMKQSTMGRKIQFLFFRSFLLVLKKKSFWEEDWALGYNSMKFCVFPDISSFPMILGLKLLGNTWGNLYIPYLSLIFTIHFTCSEKKTWSDIEKSQNIMTMIVCKFFFCFLCLN